MPDIERQLIAKLKHEGFFAQNRQVGLVPVTRDPLGWTWEAVFPQTGRKYGIGSSIQPQALLRADRLASRMEQDGRITIIPRREEG
jgi:hypothetical protein